MGVVIVDCGRGETEQHTAEVERAAPNGTELSVERAEGESLAENGMSVDSELTQ